MSDFDESKFDDGASYLVSDRSFKQYVNNAKTLGRPDEGNGNLFCAPKAEIDAAIANSNGDIRKLEAQLGLEEGSLGDGPIHRVDINNPSEHNIREATGNESGANCYFNTPCDENGELPNVVFCEETNEKGESWTARDSEGREIIDADKSDPKEIAKLNGRYATNYGELKKAPDGTNLPNGDIHEPDLTGYKHTTSAGTYEGVTDEIPNTAENVSHSTISGWKRGENGDLTVTSDDSAYSKKPNDLKSETSKSSEEPSNSDSSEGKGSGMPTAAAGADKTDSNAGKQGSSDGMSTTAADSGKNNSSGERTSGGMSTTAAGQGGSAPVSVDGQSHGSGQSM